MEITDAGVLSAAEPGTVRANLTFPTLTCLAGGTLLATLRAGPTKDSEREAIELYRSDDGGRSWAGPVRPFASPVVDRRQGTLKLCYLTELSPQHLLAAAMWVDRKSFPGQPLFNPATEGCLPMAILLADSRDAGATWAPWRVVTMPEELGPPSLTSPILKLGDGRLAMSIETNKPYLDSSRWRQRAVFLHSSDRGANWSAPEVAAEDSSGRVFNWDLRCAVAPDGRIGTFAWTYDTEAARYLNIHRRVSGDGGHTWSAPEDLGIADQAARPAILPDGRVVLPWVDRFGTCSIRARVAPDLSAAFDTASDVTIYTHRSTEPDGGDTAATLASMDMWSFGLPFATALPDGDVLVAYYAGTPAAMDIRWARLRP